MRLIDVDELLKRAYVISDKMDIPIVTIPINEIEDLPTIDAVSVVRCKECKHKYQEPWHNGVKAEGECEIWQRATLADDFCSCAERRQP